MTIFKHDPLYWGISAMMSKQLMGFMGVNDEVIAGLAPEQRGLLDPVVDYLNSVAPHSAGAAFDSKATMPNERIAAIRAPTLIIHATEDTLRLFHNAEFACAAISSARLNGFEKGGHLLIAVEPPTIESLAQRFILANIGK